MQCAFRRPRIKSFCNVPFRPSILAEIGIQSRGLIRSLFWRRQTDGTQLFINSQHNISKLLHKTSGECCTPGVPYKGLLRSEICLVVLLPPQYHQSGLQELYSQSVQHPIVQFHVTRCMNLIKWKKVDLNYSEQLLRVFFKIFVGKKKFKSSLNTLQRPN